MLFRSLKASLVDPNAMGLDGRVHLQPLAREAAVQKLLAEGRINEMEQLLIRIYNIWLEQGTFNSEQEQAILISDSLSPILDSTTSLRQRRS